MPKPEGVAIAPGRVNLIGEHTDYNDGFVLPVALDRTVRIAFRARDDRLVRAATGLRHESREFTLDRLDPQRIRGWAAYIAGVAWALAGDGIALRGADLEIESDVPNGAGLSSSAALEVACGLALATVAGASLDAARIATLCRRAENDFVGVACGVMDQMASACAREGHAVFLDCRSLAIEHVPIPASVAIVVIDTGARRSLASSEYNLRRAACERVAAALSVAALRDTTLAQLESARDAIDPNDCRRAAHVIAENDRVLRTVAALRTGDVAAVGRLLVESHTSLRDLYEVSSPELDAAVDAAMSQPGCLGARMTGAGFGGCAVALVERMHVAAFTAAVPRSFACVPSAGAHVVRT